MVIFDGQQLGLTRRKPVFGRRTLTLRAVSVATRVVGKPQEFTDRQRDDQVL